MSSEATLIPVLGRFKQEDQEFKMILCYMNPCLSGEEEGKRTKDNTEKLRKQ